MSSVTKDIYETVLKETDGLDAIYEDYIIHLVGTFGLQCLRQCKILETCGSVNGRTLYTLDRKRDFNN